MPNFSDLSRKEQVLHRLEANRGEWVDGVELANEVVGGSEGLKRLRELRDDGWLIQKRQKPGSDQYQYRLALQQGADGAVTTRVSLPRQEPHADDRSAAGAGVPRSSPAPHPAQSTWMDPQSTGPKRDTIDYDWKPAKRVRGQLEHTFWVTKHQRAIGAIADAGDGRWLWGLMVPKNKVAGTPNTSAGSGVAPSKNEAILAVEARVREVRDERA